MYINPGSDNKTNINWYILLLLKYKIICVIRVHCVLKTINIETKKNLAVKRIFMGFWNWMVKTYLIWFGNKSKRKIDLLPLNTFIPLYKQIYNNNLIWPMVGQEHAPLLVYYKCKEGWLIWINNNRLATVSFVKFITCAARQGLELTLTDC